MDQVGLSMEEKYNLFQVVAAVLHLGNITFEENTADRKGVHTYIKYVQVIFRSNSMLFTIFLLSNF